MVQYFMHPCPLRALQMLLIAIGHVNFTSQFQQVQFTTPRFSLPTIWAEILLGPVHEVDFIVTEN